jgi:hypothetical protein
MHPLAGNEVAGEVIPDIVESLRAQSLLVRKGSALPNAVETAVKLKAHPISDHWMFIAEFRAADFHRELDRAGWHFFFLPPEIHAAALRFNRKHALASAIKKVLAIVDANKLNSFEVTEIKTREFLGAHYVTCSGYMRHVQASPFLLS